MSKTRDTQQRALCDRYGTACDPPLKGQKVGIARNVRDGVKPIHGLRHPAKGDTCGWYIWAGGEPDPSPDFFMPLHVEHLHEWCPHIVRFLGLPAGWRFLTDGVYEDVWEDPTLLET